MTSRFDSFEKDLRDALASEDLPSAGFADRVMARVAETPQLKKTPPAYRKWLVSAAACLVVAAALIPLLRDGGLDRGNESTAQDLYAADTSDRDTVDTSDMDAADNGSLTGEAPVGQSAPTSDGKDTREDSNTQQKQQTPDGDGSSARGDMEFAVNGAAAMDDALARAADALTQQGCTLTVTAREGAAVQVSLTAADGAAADTSLLDAAMTAEGFTARDGWYIFEEDLNP